MTLAQLSAPSPGGVATVLDDKLTLCLADGCQKYDPCSDMWQSAVFPGVDPARGFAKAAFMPDGRWWIFGGAENGTYKWNVIMYENGGFTLKPDMPTGLGKWAHCAVAVNSTHIFLAGGKTGSGNSQIAYLLDTTTDQWIRLPDLRVPRHWHACSVIGNEVMVIGNFQGPGINDTEIFSLTTLQRRDGPATPGGLKFCKTRIVPYKDSFLTVGGFLGTENIADVYEYNPTTPGWDLFSESLDGISASHTVAVVDSARMTC